jgi:hypothetical protein
MDLSFVRRKVLDDPLQKESVVFRLKEDGLSVVPSVVEVVEMIWQELGVSIWHR